NEMLVQYPYGRPRQIRQVVPDNMVVIHPEPLDADTSFDLPLQPVRPYWVLEYVSKRSRRKDYEDSFWKYERELKVPYYLLFYPAALDLTLFRHTRRKYVAVRPNAAERMAIGELELEMGLMGSWVRFWYQGQLLALPAERERQLQQAEERTRQAQEQAQQAQEQALRAQEQAQQSQEQALRAQEQAEQERRQKELLLAQLRDLGIEPRS